MTLNYISKKLLSAIFTLFLIVSTSFFMLRSLPGSPFDEGHILDPEIINKLEAKYGLDKPVIEQFISYIKNLLIHGDLGPSLKYTNRDVIDILADAVPLSLELGLIAFILAFILGICLGTFAALYPQRSLGKFANFISGLGMSMPSFVFAGILISIFGLQLNWLPVALWEGPEYIIMPALTLAIAPTAYITRITRSAMLDEINKQYIRSAMAKGLSYWQIVSKHALMNSLAPIITLAGPLMAILVTGSFVVEYIFALPGMGKYFITAFTNRDYFLISGVIIVFATILLLVNTLVDILVLRLNPRSR